jgi:hypothetical protein
MASATFMLSSFQVDFCPEERIASLSENVTEYDQNHHVTSPHISYQF